MTPTVTQSAFRVLFDRFAHKASDPETLRPSWELRDDEDEEEHSFVRRDEAFYWGWSMNAFL